MLTRGLGVFFPYPSVDKDLSALVIEAEKFLKPLDSHGIVYISSNKGAEFDEISKAFHHLSWYMPFERSQVHLLCHISAQQTPYIIQQPHVPHIPSSTHGSRLQSIV